MELVGRPQIHDPNSEYLGKKIEKGK